MGRSFTQSEELSEHSGKPYNNSKNYPWSVAARGTQTVLASPTETAVTHQYQQTHVSTQRSLFSLFPCQGSLIPSPQGDTRGPKRFLLWHEPCWCRTARVTGHCRSSTSTAQPQPSLKQPLSWIWLGKTQEEQPLEGQRGVYSVSWAKTEWTFSIFPPEVEQCQSTEQ